MRKKQKMGKLGKRGGEVGNPLISLVFCLFEDLFDVCDDVTSHVTFFKNLFCLYLAYFERYERETIPTCCMSHMNTECVARWREMLWL